ncbi:TolC family outer membrane protein [Sulfuritalea sp.]|uniref:TolC family outer membrane protein n=1 Tax=Sulfuritalea sp. TaxID=2480090 RepID=UPI001AD0DDF4|nr:TolC family outer membrane protein [Sulfuritalea sp.]MBN8473912.1 TolC family outer membrane protein [Sulfuritalea sp.]
MRNVLFLMIAGCLSSGLARGADLMAVYRDALAYDAQFAAAKATVDAGREKLPQGRSGLLPTIGFGASTTWTDSETTARVTGATTANRDYNSNGWEVRLTQPLFRWQNWVAYNQAELAVAQAEAQFGLARQDLIVRSAQAYFDVLLAQDVLATAKAQKVAIAEQLESAKRNFEVGTATITDTHEAQARYDLTSAQEIAAQNDLNVKRQALRAVIGKEPEGLKNLKPGVQLAGPQPADIAKWVEMAETASASVQIYQALYEIAVREIEKQRAGHYPTLDLVATNGRSGAGGGTTGGFDSKSSTVGLQLSIPIFAGGVTASRDREAVALKEKAAADLENARRTAALNARQAYLGVSSGLAQVKAYEAALTSSQSALDSNKLGYEVGVRINIDVLNAQSQLFDTRQKLAKARLDTLGALLKLKAAAGSLSENDVAAINGLLD